MGLACRVQGAGCRDPWFGLRFNGFGFRVLGFGFRVSGLEFGVSDFGCSRPSPTPVSVGRVNSKKTVSFPRGTSEAPPGALGVLSAWMPQVAVADCTCGSKEGSYLRLVDFCITHL